MKKLILVFMLLCSPALAQELDVRGALSVTKDFGYENPNYGISLRFNHRDWLIAPTIQWDLLYAKKLYLDGKHGVHNSLQAGARVNYKGLFGGGGLARVAQVAPEIIDNTLQLVDPDYTVTGYVEGGGYYRNYEFVGQYIFESKKDKLKAFQAKINADYKGWSFGWQILVAPNYVPEFQPHLRLTGIRNTVYVGKRFKF